MSEGLRWNMSLSKTQEMQTFKRLRLLTGIPNTWCGDKLEKGQWRESRITREELKHKKVK